jgi:polysaccharide export outer membrane protein
MNFHRFTLSPATVLGAALLLSVVATAMGQSLVRPESDVAASTTEFALGPEDVLGVLVWKEAELSGDMTVRTDGMITLPLIRDVKAAGLTPNELAEHIEKRLREYVTDASVTVVVRQMKSRRVYITGEVGNPGAYTLASPLTVMQLIAIAGGLNEFADANGISVMRTVGGKTTTLKFEYKNVAKGKTPEQNIQLKPGDTVVVPER